MLKTLYGDVFRKLTRLLGSNLSGALEDIKFYDLKEMWTQLQVEVHYNQARGVYFESSLYSISIKTLIDEAHKAYI